MDGAAGPRDEPTEEDSGILYAGTMRLRGAVLELVGRLYTMAEFKLHQIGSPTSTAFKIFSDWLRNYGCAFGPHSNWYVEMSIINVAARGQIRWEADYKVNYAPPFPADDYINIIKLGNSVVKKWMMFVWCTDENDIWVVAPQTEGVLYSLETSLDTLDVPNNLRREVHGFGQSTWTDGQPIPQCYLAKDLSMRLIETKIRIVMGAWTNHIQQA